MADVNSQSHPRSILVLEPDHPSRQTALRLLADLGYDALQASDCDEAARTLQETPRDLVFLAGAFCETGGVAAIDRIRDSVRAEHMPWIVAIAEPFPEEGATIDESPVNDVVQKPLDRTRLQRAIENSVAVHADVFDLEAMEKLNSMAGEESGDLIREISEIYLQDSASRVREIHRALAARDAPVLTRACHTVKGSSAQLGAKHLSALCAHMEALAKENRIDEVADCLVDFKKEFSRVSFAMKKFFHADPVDTTWKNG